MANSALNRPFSGSEELSKVLQGIAADVRAEVLQHACGKAAVPIKVASAGYAPKRSGALKASIAIKVISDKTRGTAAALIGPDRNYYRAGSRLKKDAGRHGADKPSNYAHLVEFGHLSGVSSERFGGFAKGTTVKANSRKRKQVAAKSFVLPRPFMRPGFIAGAPAAELIMQREIGAGIEKARAKRVKAGTHVR